ncbi:hypothetical protein ZWY2020_025122 [Hordeum vulgare]|nr:hypothetical protein ZWY2020_025122 [Hordeum vulgare]
MDIEKVNMVGIVRLPEAISVERYIRKYKGDVPELLDLTTKQREDSFLPHTAGRKCTGTGTTTARCMRGSIARAPGSCCCSAAPTARTCGPASGTFLRRPTCFSLDLREVVLLLWPNSCFSVYLASSILCGQQCCRSASSR